jgi:alkyl sulfatase BDS1-like metallo-beta-lactamase superfamily hydrolase
MTGLKDTRPGSTEIHFADQKVATRINDFIYMSEGSTNVYLVETGDGAVLINTGLGVEAPIHRAAFEAVSKLPIRRIILLQGHVDHVGGLGEFQADRPDVIAHQNNAICQADDARIAQFRAARTNRFFPDFVEPWLAADRAAAAAGKPPRQATASPNILFADRMSFSQGGVDFELIHAPGGETVDSVLVWLPQFRILFSGNTLGPLFPHMPNFHTVRGDRLRFALPYLDACETMLQLEPELLITGHFAPISGGELIASELRRLRDAVRYVHDETVKGMNAGKDPFALMREIKLPPELAVGEDYGTVPWTVRAVWHGYGGWFLFQSTTELGDVPVRDVYSDLAALAGADRLVELATRRLSEGEPLAALHLVEVALAGEREHLPAWRTYRAIHRVLLQRAHSRNRWERFWIKGELSRAEAKIETLAGETSR